MKLRLRKRNSVQQLVYMLLQAKHLLRLYAYRELLIITKVQTLVDSGRAEVILGVQWLQLLGPITVDYSKLTMDSCGKEPRHKAKYQVCLGGEIEGALRDCEASSPVPTIENTGVQKLTLNFLDRAK
ncbi:hypothetical protein NE237_025186 [Protea cynaroides]|uniref:Uncharacterized protein n=1 Tax=Protea cynaroides TaxID=273540 RepID=A0A9Q0H4S1_9MAGN|nr:hypothetical protein NE237_025186 [Protea cynaroides]